MIENIFLKGIMKSPAVTAFVDDPFSKVEEKLRQKGIRHLPVVDHQNKVVGLITQRDLYRIVSPRLTEEGPYFDKAALDTFILKYVMTQNPMVMHPEDRFSEAVKRMAELKYGCIPVVDRENRIVGIVTETDILKYIARNL